MSIFPEKHTSLFYIIIFKQMKKKNVFARQSSIAIYVHYIIHNNHI